MCQKKVYIFPSAKTLAQEFELIYLGAGLDLSFVIAMVMLSEFYRLRISLVLH